MLDRLLCSHLLRLAGSYPVVTVVGPRQSGKSTLCSLTFPAAPVVNLELPDIRSRVLSDPRGFIESCEPGTIIDEVQYAPELPSYIQVAVDSSKKNGHFILTGSQQFELMETVTQSLAGRTALLRLLPFAHEELSPELQSQTLDARLYSGAYPRVIFTQTNPTEAYSFYVQTYLERDVRKIINVRNLGLFERFLKLTAARSGQILNITNLGNEAGINQSTVSEWLTVLEASFVLFRVQPHFNNLSKRTIKAPKLYFYDTGLLCFLLGIENANQIATHPLRGAIFESYIASELVKLRYNRVRESNLYYFRDSAGHEVDFVLDHGATVTPIEVKASGTFNSTFFKDLNYYRQLGAPVTNPTVIYTGPDTFISNDIAVVPYQNLAQQPFAVNSN